MDSNTELPKVLCKQADQKQTAAAETKNKQTNKISKNKKRKIKFKGKTSSGFTC